MGLLTRGSPSTFFATRVLYCHFCVMGTRVAAFALLSSVACAIQIVNSSSGTTTLTWVVHDDDDSLVTFNGTCSTPDGSPITWCGFAISPTGGMWPSEAWILQSSSDGAVWIEDRNLIAYASPDCYEVQLSSLISASVSPAGDSIQASCAYYLLCYSHTRFPYPTKLFLPLCRVPHPHCFGLPYCGRLP